MKFWLTVLIIKMVENNLKFNSWNYLSLLAWSALVILAKTHNHAYMMCMHTLCCRLFFVKTNYLPFCAISWVGDNSMVAAVRSLIITVFSLIRALVPTAEQSIIIIIVYSYKKQQALHIYICLQIMWTKTEENNN